MNPVASPPVPRPGLARLSRLPLNPFGEAVLAVARQSCGGSPAHRQRKLAEAHDLLALSQMSGRLEVHWLDLSSDLRAKVQMRVPVPCRPDPAGQLQVVPRVLLGVTYPEKAMLLPQPGHAFVRILAPGPVWHSNVSADANQVLCLGPSLPAGIPLKEILLMTYGALSMQTIQLDAWDAAGVLNTAAADWWQRNTHRIPLSTEPFLAQEVNDAT